MKPTKILNPSEINVLKSDLPPAPGEYPPNSADFNALKNSIKEHGLLTPIFVNDKNEIVSNGGHFRYWAAKIIGLKEIPVIIVNSPKDVDKIFEAEVKAMP